MPVTKLHESWYAMGRRAASRRLKGEKTVRVIDIDSWLKEAVSRGWSEDCYVCRRKDKGDYSWDNIYFGTAQQNTEDCHAKYYSFINPKGDIVEVYNLNKFCRENALHQAAMSRLYYGGFHSKTRGRWINVTQHKGWTKSLQEIR